MKFQEDKHTSQNLVRVTKMKREKNKTRKLAMKKERLQETAQKYKVQETGMNNSMKAKWITWREWRDSQLSSVQFSSVQSLSRAQLFAIPWIVALEASLFITYSWNLFRLIPIVSAMPFSHLILCHALLFLSPIPPSIRVFSSESKVHSLRDFRLCSKWSQGLPTH